MRPLAPQSDTFAASVEADGDFMRDFRSSRTLTVQAGDVSVRFSLEGVAAAVTAWENCYAAVKATALSRT